LDWKTSEKIFEKFENMQNFRNLPGAGRFSKLEMDDREMLIEMLGEQHISLKDIS